MRLLLAVALLLGSHVARADDLAGAPPAEPTAPVGEPDYLNVRVTTGAIVFAGGYLASVGYATASDHQGSSKLFVPIAGPWLALDDWTTCPIASSRCDEHASAKLLLITDGVIQAAGMVALIDGLIDPSHRFDTFTVANHEIRVTPARAGLAFSTKF